MKFFWFPRRQAIWTLIKQQITQPQHLKWKSYNSHCCIVTLQRSSIYPTILPRLILILILFIVIELFNFTSSLKIVIMNHSIRICFLIVLVGWTTVTAFVPTVVDVLHSTSPPVVSLFLHPKQAAELEACAFECYCLESSKFAQRRRSLHDDARSNAMSTMMSNGSSNTIINNKHTTTTGRRAGPVAWCRRVISGSTANRRRHV